MSTHKAAEFNLRRPLSTHKSGENRPIIITLVACLLGLAVIQLATQTTGLVSNLTPVAVLGGAALLIASWRNWELGVQSLLVILIVEGGN